MSCTAARAPDGTARTSKGGSNEDEACMSNADHLFERARSIEKATRIGLKMRARRRASSRAARLGLCGSDDGVNPSVPVEVQRDDPVPS